MVNLFYNILKKLHMYDLFIKYKSVITYLFFGVCTTIVNIVVYWGCAHPLGLGVLVSSIIAWVFAVLFAYITNRKWVFESKTSGKDAIIKEILSFFGCRLATGVIDWTIMYVFVDILHYNDMVMKILANVIVVILNYVFSKVFVFRKNKQEE